jgi:O-antigen/teichoic acid export membrane protein
MIRNLLSTTATRLFSAVLNLGIVWVIARFMGAAVLGTVSLIILGISIIQLFTAVLAGSSLVYQVSRRPVAELMVAAWIWIPVIGVPVWALLAAFNMIPAGFRPDVLLLATIGSLVTINQNLFLGKEKISTYNAMVILQSVLLFAVLLILIFGFNLYQTDAYIVAQYVSIGICVIIGTILNFPPRAEFHFPKKELVIEAFRFGGFLQAASIMQLFNYRLSYYLIEKFFDRATLGVFSLGVQIAESVWIIAKSMATLLYSRLSNSNDDEYSGRLTASFIKIITLLSIVIMLLIVLLPESVFVFIFHSEFGKITTVVAGLAPGIIAVAVSLMLSHYFSGTGHPHHNTISSGIGLIFTFILGYTLIPVYGLVGAAITASASYLSSMLYQLIVFRKFTSLSWLSFIPTQEDIKKLRKELREGLTL